jgi:hypothetical protein
MPPASMPLPSIASSTDLTLGSRRPSNDLPPSMSQGPGSGSLTAHARASLKQNLTRVFAGSQSRGLHAPAVLHEVEVQDRWVGGWVAALVKAPHCGSCSL